MTSLLSWFAANGRDLPWRHSRDPYAIWVSEVMLQQTQVQTVIPYWERWMQELPNLAALAAISEARLLKLWEGLGYYSRARNLQRAARAVVENHSGAVPSHRDQLLELSGVGPYTAGAIASLAFNQPEPLIDGNVARVLARIHQVPGDPRDPEPRQRLWKLASQWMEAVEALDSSPSTPLAAGRFSAWNQALMELGATVCIPRNPACTRCPVAFACHAHQTDTVDGFPQTTPRPIVTLLRYAVVVLRRSGKWWMRQRGPNDVNAGLWEFPQLELANSESDPVIVAAQKLGVPETLFSRLPRIRHAITRYRITLEVLMAPVRTVPDSLGVGVWITPLESQKLALTSAHRKIARNAAETFK